jgi:hypothetical protein
MGLSSLSFRKKACGKPLANVSPNDRSTVSVIGLPLADRLVIALFIPHIKVD